MANRKEDVFGPNIVYYCKDCEKIVDAERVGRKYVFKCPICKTKNVAFGTEKSIKSFYHVSEEETGEVSEVTDKENTTAEKESKV
jgi:hypothetical protein